MSRLLATLAVVVAAAVAADASASCRNNFLVRSEGPRQIITLLTGKLTFQEAQKLAQAISSKQSPPLEWLDDTGKIVARQYGELKVVRPMPVRCDNKPSGVIMIATFGTVQKPQRKINVKFNAQTTVAFEEQGK